MKKWLMALGIVVMSSNAQAYRGATVDFAKELFNITYNMGMEGHIAQDYQRVCVAEKLNAKTPSLAKQYVNDILSVSEIKQLDKFFDMPYGKAALQRIRELNNDPTLAISLETAFDDLDARYEQKPEYGTYLPILEKLFDESNIERFVEGDESVELIVDIVLRCDLVD